MNFDSKNPIKPMTLMKPEGSLKVAVLNGSRQLDQVIDGKWNTLKVLPENGLPKGIYQLSDAIKPIPSKDEKTFSGQILHVDNNYLYQLTGPNEILKHDKHLLSKAVLPETKLSVGQYCSIKCQAGKILEVSKNLSSSSHNAPAPLASHMQQDIKQPALTMTKISKPKM
ncbi:IncP-type DNA transfer protein TraB [Acinetobacter junii CIP 107470 = MTCC 11364]|uniref:IncP-type DNA transfer protein TraB n=1 Tax=Acinetobacter junii CIP 107470 = MTCC 11364 TaxID=1217666 RepID=S7WUJ5_ACIJU|nr:KfrB domain-containing protein [Acinetobacter junii]ENV52095.1 hypothetical protein F953_00507 [Acinetobacter junii CIP 107470 = MTCC 11364]EPR86871.1 IncP-type DNA transfer protein TraB [Acinetobacter junii CIP 107470 = MTCC 11364]